MRARVGVHSFDIHVLTRKGRAEIPTQKRARWMTPLSVSSVFNACERSNPATLATFEGETRTLHGASWRSPPPTHCSRQKNQDFFEIFDLLRKKRRLLPLKNRGRLPDGPLFDGAYHASIALHARPASTAVLRTPSVPPAHALDSLSLEAHTAAGLRPASACRRIASLARRLKKTRAKRPTV